MKKFIILLGIISLVSFSDTYKKENKTIRNNVGTVKIDGKTYDSVGQDRRVRFVIVHYTAVDKDSSIKILTQQQVSSHYLITDDPSDPVYNFVSEDNRSWHAGLSNWGRLSNLNDSSIGIEIVNNGFITENGNMSFYPYSDDQIKKVAVLLKDIIDRYALEPTSVLGHSDIAPQRKQDPGPLFPWEDLYKKYQIGMWYDEDVKNMYLTSFNDNFITPQALEVQTQLEKFGYSINKTGTYDKQTTNVIRAFQFHFRPSGYSGVIDNETYAILLALNEKYKK